jgi:hypothetical protein
MPEISTTDLETLQRLLKEIIAYALEVADHATVYTRHCADDIGAAAASALDILDGPK